MSMENKMTHSTSERAAIFRNLHEGNGLMLPNAWDAASARIFETAGFPAIGTTSSGIAYTRGLRDGQRITRDAMMVEIANIARAVEVPVTADIEAGYGAAPADVAITVRDALAAGAAGINLEDNTRRPASATLLFGVGEQAERIAAARAAANQQGIEIIINDRTDTLLTSQGRDVEERLEMTAERGAAYLAAGADLVFVPGVLELSLVRRLVAMIPGPISLMARPGGPPASELFAAGARRVSIGQIAMLAALGTVAAAAAEIRDSGTWSTIAASFFGFAEAEKLFDLTPA
jgi:2-methylisocitrate lyase-like PEP mutase family enzyme